MTQRQKWLGGIMALAFAAGVLTGAQSKSKYEPTHEQYLELQVKQKDAIIAQISFNQAQQTLSQAYKDLNDAAEATKKANGWPKEIQFNQQTLTFAPQQPAPTTPPTPSPAPAQPSEPK